MGDGFQNLLKRDFFFTPSFDSFSLPDAGGGCCGLDKTCLEAAGGRWED